MKKLLLLLVIMLLPMVTRADAVEIDGIYYNLISKVKTAEVTSNPNQYTGTVVIPESVTYEGETYDVTTIGYNAFSTCRGLISVAIPRSILTIGQGAFRSCSNLTSFTIPNSVTKIEGWAFSHCSGLTSITIPNSVLSIGENAFQNCTSLDSITIPNSITGIASHMFDSCTGLTSITIPNSVTSIGSYAFAKCTGLTSITIPNSVTSTGEHVFSDCSGLTSVAIPNSMTSISNCAFSGCSSLPSVTIPNSVRYIDSGAFEMCSALTTVSIGSGVKNIHGYAFYLCPELINVFCYAESVPRSNNDIFKDSYIEYATLHVPEQSINSYQSTEPWAYFKNIIKIDIPKYTLIYMIDGEVYKTCEIEEGKDITPEPAPTKEGYAFSGWSEIPKTMPAHDVTVTGTFTINSYKLTYMIYDKVYKETMYEYGATINPEPQPEGDYATFEWIDLPPTMPAHDVVVYASYTSGIAELLMNKQNIVCIYSPCGKRLNVPKKGVNIIHMSDGKSKMIVVK